MHEIMVNLDIPPQCHLTAIFDVRTINNVIKIKYMSTLTLCLHLQSCHSGTILGLCFFNTCDLLTMTYSIRDLPHIVCQILSRPAPSRLIYAAQYRLDGVVKQFRHPYRLEVLREKESKAVAVSAIFSSRRLSHIILL